jgi:hypothetical protein
MSESDIRVLHAIGTTVTDLPHPILDASELKG